MLAIYPELKAQESIADLFAKLEHSKADTSKVWLYHDLGFKYSIRNTDSSRMFVEKALDLSEQLDYTKGIVNSLHRLSYSYKLTGDLEAESQLALRAMEVAKEKKHYSFLGKGYKHLGDIAREKIQLDSAFYFYSQAIEHYEKFDEAYNSFIVYLDLHRVFLQRGQIEKAEQQLLTAYEITKPKAIRKDYGLALHLLLHFYFDQKEWEKYADYSETYLRLIQGTEPSISDNIYHRPIFYFDDNYQERQKVSVLEDLIELHHSKNNSFSLTSSYLALYKLKLKSGDEQGAIQALKGGLRVAEQLSSPVLITGFNEKIAGTYESMGDYASAFIHFKTAKTINDSLNTIVNQQNLDRLNIEFETTKKEEALARQELLLEKEILKKRNANFLAVAAVLLALIAGCFNISNQKPNKQLKAQKAIIQKSLSEKEFLLKEIHHRVKNNLQVISSLLNWQSKYIEDVKAKSAIREGQNRVKSMALIHQNLYQKENLAAVNVADYIEKLSTNLFDSYNITPNKVRLESKVMPIDLDVDVLIPLGLILNELISNALKHAFPDGRSGTVSIQLEKDAESLKLQVSDDGIGIPEQNANSKKSSFGYELIETFVAKLKAKMDIKTDSGTMIQLTIPTSK